MQSQRIEIVFRNVALSADLIHPPHPEATIIFAHGSGSGRHSPRNRFVANALLESGFASLMVDLLTEEEETYDTLTRELRFDIDLLSRRLLAAIDWVRAGSADAPMPIGLFGASTGAAAALRAAGERPADIAAIVARGGRPDLAEESLDRMYAPTLFLVGGHDGGILEINQLAFDRIPAQDKKLALVPRATHLFEEPGALEMVAEQAREWFAAYLLERPSARQVG